jgi:hypothetical protein
MMTVHIRTPEGAPHPVELQVNQQMIEPMGFQRSVPLADASRASDHGIGLAFAAVPDRPQLLVRLELMPSAVGLVPLQVSDGTDSVEWSMLVVP